MYEEAVTSYPFMLLTFLNAFILRGFVVELTRWLPLAALVVVLGCGQEDPDHSDKISPVVKSQSVWSDALVLSGHDDVVADVAFRPDGVRVASGSFDKSLKIWDAASGRELADVVCLMVTGLAVLSGAEASG